MTMTPRMISVVVEYASQEQELRRLAVRLGMGEIDTTAYNTARQSLTAPLEVLR
jgi:hypothetical protein